MVSAYRGMLCVGRLWLVNSVADVACYMQLLTYSRLSLFRLSEVRSPRYTGNLVWHGMLARCLLHKTCPEMLLLAIPYTGQCWLPQTRFSM